jgi:hypothetical protein
MNTALVKYMLVTCCAVAAATVVCIAPAQASLGAPGAVVVQTQ